MNLFEVYPLFDIEPVNAEGAYLWDQNQQKYLDLYGGHAVISIGHSHPHYVKSIEKQLNHIGFYSNSVQNSLQGRLAQKLGKLSGYDTYSLFLCNSGAEANENALKLASFHTKRGKVLAFSKGFHGRTSAAVAATDNPKIVAPINANHEIERVPWGDLAAAQKHLQTKQFAAVIIEGVQGVGGVQIPTPAFLEALSQTCKATGTVLILDEIQSGYGRTGKFFAHQYANIQPDLITIAKGMGNGFPIGGVLISPEFEPWYGMLGTTFGGNHLACAAGLAVLEVLEQEKLIDNALKIGHYLKEKLATIEHIQEVRGLGLMIGLEFDFPIAEMRKQLLKEHHIFTGVSGKNIIRLLPPLGITQAEADQFIDALQKVIHQKITTSIN
ncbi:MAG TPA: aspartate aminotransferase family protein [Microscillaceae bacterium]|nr:aspartate aminotransferase family protein [Microscillaceae bacterium]